MIYRNTKNGAIIKTKCKVEGDWELVESSSSLVEEAPKTKKKKTKKG